MEDSPQIPIAAEKKTYNLCHSRWIPSNFASHSNPCCSIPTRERPPSEMLVGLDSPHQLVRYIPHQPWKSVCSTNFSSSVKYGYINITHLKNSHGFMAFMASFFSMGPGKWTLQIPPGSVLQTSWSWEAQLALGRWGDIQVNLC